MATKRYGAGPRHSITSPVKAHSMRPIIGDVPMRRGRGSIPEVCQSHGRTRTLMPPTGRGCGLLHDPPISQNGVDIRWASNDGIDLTRSLQGEKAEGSAEVADMEWVARAVGHD